MWFFWLVSTVSTLQITFKLDPSIVTMSIPLSQLTVQHTQKEFNSLADKIAAKYEQLDSSRFGTVGTPSFNVKSL